MPVSGDGILEAAFDPAWAAVRLIVDGGMWPDPVDTITMTRVVAGQPAEPVRGLQARSVVGGYFVGSDHECPLDSSVTYTVAGCAGTTPVASATVTVSTTGAQWGVWMKAAGKPDLTCRVRWCEVGGVASETIGDAYTIAGGGGAVAHSAAQWSGIHADEVPIVVATESPAELARFRALLTTARVLLLQTGAPQELDSGWYLVRGVTRSNPAQYPEFPERRFTMRLVRTGVPAGQGSGIAGTTWAGVMDAYPTWADVMAAHDTWFDVLRGA